MFVCKGLVNLEAAQKEGKPASTAIATGFVLKHKCLVLSLYVEDVMLIHFFWNTFVHFPPPEKWAGLCVSERAGESILPATTPPTAFLFNASALGPSERRGQSPENNHIFLYSSHKLTLWVVKFSVTSRKPMLKIFIFAKSSAFICSCDAC